jgi:glycine/D-amino acid oxidase-like deaminating enzyme
LIETEVPKSKILRSFVSGPDYYVLQTPQGNMVIGGGEDSVGFDVSVDGDRIKEAWSEAVSYVPVLKSLKQVSMTACLRPYAPGGLPVMGRSKKYSNLIFATGHYRSGFCLAPITGELISELIVDGKTTIDLEPFSPNRFESA